MTSEPSHTGRPCLKLAMRALLTVASICKQPVSSNTSTTPDPSQGTSDDTTVSTNADIEIMTEDTITTPLVHSSDDDATQLLSASVHALNILRALYRDSRLGEHVIPFIPEGVEIAIHGFSASSWLVRMLYN